MESFQQNIARGKQKVYVADHMLSTTFTLLKDTKILLAILENVFDAYVSTLRGFLEHERMFKRIPPYNKTVDSEIGLFESKLMQKHGFSKEHLDAMLRLQEILKAHNASPVEFSRDSSYIIASDKYDLTKISPEDLKKYIRLCKEFITTIEKVISDA